MIGLLSAAFDIPLFPLNAVLFPGGSLPLRIFEMRYMDMAKSCLKDGAAFGVCLIQQGAEVIQPGAMPALPHDIGTLARIAGWDMQQLGVLNVVAHGEQRFRILTCRSERSGLLRAEVEAIADEPVLAIPAEFARLVPLLRRIVADLAESAPPQPHRFFDAAWVGYRFAELLPISQSARQKLLELDDSASRLKIVWRLLQQKSRPD